MNPNQEDIDIAVEVAISRASIRIQNPIDRGDRVRMMANPIDSIIIINI